MTEKFDYSGVGDLVSSPFVRPPQSPGYDTRIKVNLYEDESSYDTRIKVNNENI